MDEADFNAASIAGSNTVIFCDDGGDFTGNPALDLGAGHAGITIQVASGDTVTIDSTGGETIDFDSSADGITIDGVDTSMPYTASPRFIVKGGTNRAIDINTGANNNTIQYLHIILEESGPGDEGIAVDANSGTVIQYNKIEDNGPYNGADERGRDGIAILGATNPKVIGNHIIDFSHSAVNSDLNTVGAEVYWNELEAPNRGYCRGIGIDVNSGTAYIFENWIHDMRIGNSLQQHGSGKIYFYNNIITDLKKCCDQSPATGTCIGVEDVSDWGENCDFDASAEGQVAYSDKGDAGEPAIEDVYIWHNTGKNISEGFYKSNNYNVADESSLTFGIVNNAGDDLFQEEITASGEYHYQMIIAIKNNSASPQYEWAGTIQNNVFEDGPAVTNEIFYQTDDSAGGTTGWAVPTSANSDSLFNTADDSQWTASTIDDNYETTLSLSSRGEPSAGSAVLDYGQTGLSVPSAPEISSVTHGVNLGIATACLDYDAFATSISGCTTARDSIPDVGAFELIENRQFTGVTVD
jgi:hypothetical protein